MMLVIAALSILGILVLNANRTVLETNDTQNLSELGINAVSLATSIVEEAMGKMFDEGIADSNTGELNDPKQLTSVIGLGAEGAEQYRDGGNDFNDFDDFDGLLLVYKNPVDSIITPGADIEAAIYCHNGEFTTEDFWKIPVSGRVSLFGALVQGTAGSLGVFTSTGLQNGMFYSIRHDPRFLRSGPPKFPFSTKYRLVAWWEG